MNDQPYILWIPAWYPNQLEPFAGDFLQRHAKAVSTFQHVCVMHVLRDKYGTTTKSVKESIADNGALCEIIIYYYSKPYLWGIADRFFSFLKYKSIYKNRVKDLIQKRGKPRGIHMLIAGKNFIIGRWVSAKFNLPMVLSEHWTLFLPEGVPGFKSQPFFFKRAWRQTINRLSGLSVVSDYLGKSIIALGYKKMYRVIPNVVDPKVFYPRSHGGQDEPTTRFIHVSNLNYQKNFEAIVAAFGLVQKTNNHFLLEVFGPFTKKHLESVNRAGLENCILFSGEVSHNILSGAMRNSDALILYSRFETFGCVIIEANASGIPVISSDYPVMREIITENKNGYFVKGEDIDALSKKILWFLNLQPRPDRNKLAEWTIEKYSPPVVGKQFEEWYQECFLK